MSRWARSIGTLLFVVRVCAQEEPKINVNLEGFRYPTIARSARIQGDVIFDVTASGVKLLIGSPILAAAAQRNLETWTLPPFEGGKYIVRYHYALLDETKQVTVPIGDGLDRFFLRLFHAPTKKVYEVTDCMYSDVPIAVRQAIAKDGDDYVIHVFASSKSPCAFID
jgi:hypothetical protein